MFRRVLMALNPIAFKWSFMEWRQSPRSNPAAVTGSTNRRWPLMVRRYDAVIACFTLTPVAAIVNVLPVMPRAA